VEDQKCNGNATDGDGGGNRRQRSPETCKGGRANAVDVKMKENDSVENEMLASKMQV